MMDDLAKEVVQHWEQLDGERGTAKIEWQDIANHMLPERNDYITERTPGMKRMQHVYDGMPLWALDQSSAGLHSHLTSPWSPWFLMKPEDDRLQYDQGATEWCDHASGVMNAQLSSPRAGFATASHELYQDELSVGTAIMSALEHPTKGVAFMTRPLKECCIDENDDGEVDTLSRRFPFTAKQAVQRWGNAAGEAVLKAYENKPSQRFWFHHRVAPRRKRDAQRADARNKSWQSVYVAEADQTVIAEGGFDEFPFLAPRFSKLTGEKWGRGRGSIALPDVKMLNEMMRTIIKSAQKIVDPPLMVPDSGFLVPLKTTPGSINFYTAGSRDRIEPIKTEGNVQLGIELVQNLQRHIMRVFYLDWLIDLIDASNPESAGKGITATYTMDKRDKQMQLMSPILARQHTEFTHPLLERVFAILWRRSVALRFGPGSPFRQPPPQMRGAKLQLTFESPIAVAMRANQLDGIQKWVTSITQFAQVDQRALAVVDGAALARLSAIALNVPGLAVRSQQDVQAAEDAAAQERQDAAAHAGIANLAGAARDGAGAVKALTQANQMMGPGQQPMQAAA